MFSSPWSREGAPALALLVSRDGGAQKLLWEQKD